MSLSRSVARLFPTYGAGCRESVEKVLEKPLVIPQRFFRSSKKPFAVIVLHPWLPGSDKDTLDFQ